MQFFSHLLSFITSPFSIPKPLTFEGYLSKRIGHVHWIVRTHHSFLIPFLEQIKGTTGDALLTNPLFRRHRYKKMGEFEITHENRKETYLVKIYNYPHLLQKTKQLFRRTRGFNEFYTTYLAARKGIPVEVPVACGEQKHIFTKESYLIIRKIENSCSMREYLQSSTVLTERRDVLKKFGELAKNMYESGIIQDAFSLDNFLVYSDGTGGKKVILIDFEMVSVQTKGLKDKLRVWYFAKLNREKGFTNSDRIRFLRSYTNGDFIRCKNLARRIKELTVRIQKKDAKKASRLCVHENRTFGIFKSDTFLGYYRKKYTPEMLVTLLNTLEETTRSVFYRNHFQILHFKEDTDPGFNYRYITQIWMKANALFALKINVPVPVGIFKRRHPTLQREAFLISQIPDNCISLSQCSDFYIDENHLFPLLRFAEQVSPFGVFSKGLDTQDILVQKNEKHQVKCYLGNYACFHINRHPAQKNKSINANIMKQLLEKYR
ncbi:MAG: hypothetical protein E3K36_07150 [Candidatus Brocadia sp.]|nr:hypothetical protein [Candidatus Brocadia sp.]